MAEHFPPLHYLTDFREGTDFPKELYDTCLPSYTHGNPLVRWWAWQRVVVAQRMLRSQRGTLAIDLGCGMGVMLKFLAERFASVRAIDTEPRVAEKVVADFSLTQVQTVKRTTQHLHADNESADLVVALDVLEHIPDLDAEIAELARVIKPGGYLLVSAPTENWLYLLGRRMARFKYEDDHHHRSGLAVLEAVAKSFREVRRKAILPLLTCSYVVLYQRPQTTR